MHTYILEKGYVYKLFILTAFVFLALVMYQGHIKSGGIYSILFFISLGLCAFQIASIIYVTLVQRKVEIKIDEDKISWRFFDNKKTTNENFVLIKDIIEVKTEVNYLTGNIYSNFATTFILNDGSEVILTDGLIYDFGLKKAEKITKYLLENNIGNEQDVKLSNLVKELNIDLTKEQKFSKKMGDSHYYGFISKNKKEFLSLRLQIEALYTDYKLIEKNGNNEYLIKNGDSKDSFIYLKSNVFGIFVEFYKVGIKGELKTLKEMGKRDKIGF